MHSAIDERIGQLECRLRNTQRCLVITLLGVIVAGVLGAKAPDPPAVLKANEFQVVDEKGRIAARLGVLSTNNVVKKGRPLLEMNYIDDESHLCQTFVAPGYVSLDSNYKKVPHNYVTLLASSSSALIYVEHFGADKQSQFSASVDKSGAMAGVKRSVDASPSDGGVLEMTANSDRRHPAISVQRGFGKSAKTTLLP